MLDESIRSESCSTQCLASGLEFPNSPPLVMGGGQKRAKIYEIIILRGRRSASSKCAKPHFSSPSSSSSLDDLQSGLLLLLLLLPPAVLSNGGLPKKFLTRSRESLIVHQIQYAILHRRITEPRADLAKFMLIIGKKQGSCFFSVDMQHKKEVGG